MDELDRISAFPDELTQHQLEHEFACIIERIKSAPENQDCDILMSAVFELAERQWNSYSLLSDTFRHQLDMLVLKIWSKDSLDSTEALMSIIARLGLTNAFSKVILTNPQELKDEIKTEIASAIVEFGDTVDDPYFGIRHIRKT
ncbi:hypothetical protein UNDYM_4246 [Undibacterium sp. YM2]|uniref:hypothetical protein n=1 Tax=Undibacterium sp. YM2 TaxID=2058625 RepID=UPI001331D828|nr:hypothetical protein [Undibacterium sp. YM2]BBB68499.1 hypothetical protein UNDYM_4246 [Undibacterium sp. YM2]